RGWVDIDVGRAAARADAAQRTREQVPRDDRQDDEHDQHRDQVDASSCRAVGAGIDWFRAWRTHVDLIHVATSCNSAWEPQVTCQGCASGWTRRRRGQVDSRVADLGPALLVNLRDAA